MRRIKGAQFWDFADCEPENFATENLSAENCGIKNHDAQNSRAQNFNAQSPAAAGDRAWKNSCADRYAAAKNFALGRECGGVRGLDTLRSSIVAKNLRGAQKHIAQDCKDDRDPSFARNFGAGREHGGMQNFGTENFGPESFGVKFFNAKSSNDPQSPSAALNSVAKALARSGILLRRVLAAREILRRKVAASRKALPPCNSSKGRNSAV